MGSVILGLGSNQGDRVRFLERAVEQLRAQIYLEEMSSIYETQPVGVRDQPWFLNMVCIGTTRLKPGAVLEFVHEVEDSLGRTRSGERWGPRTIDIDILAYEDRVIDRPELKIPHPRLAERAFMLEPLAEIAPDWRHPVLRKTARELLEGLNGDVVRPFSGPLPPAGPTSIL
ncbi:MAG: 2-amino-4-hydroxy-6-hydroxymethyldihydropteridine diphosphokinase [Gemmatimonadota bacterium]|nr:MAG: 2-amino-4-hydroxy-6-hydroxymethyldihydropteridine diphosphokinase [Gemmatimonadota bacterium]